MTHKAFIPIIVIASFELLNGNPLPSAFVNCVQTAWSTCTLDIGTYQVPTTLYPANGVTIVGGGTSPFSTVLQRPNNSLGNLINIQSGDSVTIRNITIDGNRYSFPNASTGCGQAASQACGPPGGYGCTAANYVDALEVVVDGTVLVDNVQFWNSAGTTPLFMDHGSGVIQWSGFYYNRSTGPFVCYHCSARSTVTNNNFEYNGTGGLALFGAGGADVYHNTFFQNRYEMPDGGGGGQVYVGYDAANIVVQDNVIDGNNWQTPTSGLINNCYSLSAPQGVFGIEVEARSYNNLLAGNEIKNNPGAGVTVGAVYSLSISGYTQSTYSNCPNCPKYIHDNLGQDPPYGIPARGIEIYTGSASGITLTQILSRNNDGEGVFITSGATGTGWSGNHCLSSRSQAAYVTSYSLANPTPASITTCP